MRKLPPMPQFCLDSGTIFSVSVHPVFGRTTQAAVDGSRVFNVWWTNLRYSEENSLVVEQQPIRARMCGFGDKVSDPRP